MTLLAQVLALSLAIQAIFVASFQPKMTTTSVHNAFTILKSTASAPGEASYLYSPVERDAHYNGNIAQYLVDLHNEKATFNFCGGMMFQLVLSDKLRSHLQGVASSEDAQPVIHPASQSMMNLTPDYAKSSFADNISIFHGRELRKIPQANGGMSFVLQLSYADPSASCVEINESKGAVAGKGADVAWTGEAMDPQGWSRQEIDTYDGWRSDRFRQWRNRGMYEEEGYSTFGKEFADDAFGLNHRFYLHYDKQNRMWLSAEDGCEGTPSEGKSLMGKLGGMLFGR